MTIDNFSAGEVLDQYRLNEIVTEVNDLTEFNEWQIVPLENGWTNYGGPHIPFAFFKDDNNVVYLRGLIRYGTIGSVPCATLPVGFRPAYRVLAQGYTNSGDGRIDVLPDGRILMLGADSAWTSLDDISFRTI